MAIGRRTPRKIRNNWNRNRSENKTIDRVGKVVYECKNKSDFPQKYKNNQHVQRIVHDIFGNSSYVIVKKHKGVK